MFRLGALLVVLIAMILGVGHYLAPDDLSGCQGPGSGHCRPAGAIVVISGGDTGARTDEAIRLFRAGFAPRLIVSGAAADKTGLSNAAAMRQQAISQGVPTEAILVEEHSETTRQNAAQVGRLLRRHDVSEVILVTSSYHMRRALGEFQTNLPEITVRAHPVAQDKQWGPLWWLTPWGWWLAGSELIKNLLFVIGVSR